MSLALFSLLVAVSHVQSEPIITDFLVQDKSLGTNSLTQQGTKFESKTVLTELVQMTSTVTGTIEKGVLKEFKLVEKDARASGEVTFADGKLTIVQNGKVTVDNKPVPFKAGSAYFSNWHPVLWQTIQTSFDNKKGETFTLIPINSLNPLEVKGRSESLPSDTPTGKRPIRFISVNMGGIDLKFAFDKEEALGVHVATQGATFIRKGFEKVFADPVLAYPELSQPTFKTRTLKSIEAPMRDGSKLISTIVLPEGDGPFPTILVRTPYGREAGLAQGAEFYAKRGYAFVSQDVRGKGDSEGTFDPFNTEVADGKDTLDWLQTQSWCNGNVGMIGGSYLGLVQWAAAVNIHPALKCIIPQVSPPEPTKNLPYDNGEFMLLGSLWWSRIVAGKEADMATVVQSLPSPKALATLPVSQVDNVAMKQNYPFFDEWLKRDTAAKWPGAFTTAQVAKVKIPVLHVSGFWDGDGIGTKLHWEALAKNGGNQWLIFGPWEHGFNAKTSFGGVDYGADSVLELNSVYLRFFDTFLQRKQVKWSEQPRVKFFVAGANKWLNTSSWPAPQAKKLTWYLGGGSSIGSKSKGTLANVAGKTSSDTYTYNPNKALSDKEIGNIMGAGNLKLPAGSLDSEGLLFRTDPMKEKTIYAGSVVADVYFKTTAKDASFKAMILDQGRDGSYYIVGMMGHMRATYKTGKLLPLTPNKVDRITIEPWWFAHEFKKGHRLVLAITSDTFPSMARNPGTGESLATATKLVSAKHTIMKGKGYPSKVTLWQLPNF